MFPLPGAIVRMKFFRECSYTNCSMLCKFVVTTMPLNRLREHRGLSYRQSRQVLLERSKVSAKISSKSRESTSFLRLCSRSCAASIYMRFFPKVHSTRNDFVVCEIYPREFGDIQAIVSTLEQKSQMQQREQQLYLADESQFH